MQSSKTNTLVRPTHTDSKGLLMSEALRDYLEHLEIEKNRQANTIRNYHLYLQRLIDFGGEELAVSDITPEFVRQFRLWLNRLVGPTGRDLTPITQNYHLIALRNFLRYLSEREIECLSPELIKLATVKRSQVTFLTIEEIRSLLGAIETESLSGKRDRAIIELLFSGGLRVSELVSLDRLHINFDHQECTVRGKGNKNRPIFISDQAKDCLKDYLEARTDNSEALFVNASRQRRDRLTTRSIQRLVSKYARLAGITKPVSPHTMRHSFATNLLMNGADLRSVQALLGHANIASTQIYTHLTDPHLKQVHRQFHGH